jgi:hypothetical protein
MPSNDVVSLIDFGSLLTEEERLIQKTVRSFVVEKEFVARSLHSRRSSHVRLGLRLRGGHRQRHRARQCPPDATARARRLGRLGRGEGDRRSQARGILDDSGRTIAELGEDDDAAMECALIDHRTDYCSGSLRCIYGFFVKGLIPAVAVAGSGTDFGAHIISLTGRPTLALALTPAFSPISPAPTPGESPLVPSKTRRRA